MFKLKSILLESKSRSESLNFQEAKKIYKQNCKKHTPQSQEIYRGTSSSSYSYGYINPSNYNRSSTGSVGNHHTLLMDNLSSWKDYPERSKSIVCSMSKRVARRYGSVYVVIPYDNEKVGIAPEYDIWQSFEKGIEKYLPFFVSTWLTGFNKVLNFLFVIYKGVERNTNGLSDDNFLKFWKQIEQISKNIDDIFNKIKKMKNDEEYRTNFSLSGKFSNSRYFNSTFRSVKTIVEENINLKNRIKKAFDPDVNNFKLKKYGKVFYTEDKDNEVWISGPCLLIKHSEYKPFLQKVRN